MIKQIFVNRKTIIAGIMLMFSMFLMPDSIAAQEINDAYIKSSDVQWVMGTASVERIVVLEKGRFVLKSFKHKKFNLEMVSGNDGEDEFSFSLGDDPARITSGTGEWKLVASRQTTLKHGELQLDITLERNSLEVTKSYVVYPGTSIIREWVSFKNVGEGQIKVVEPTFLNARICLGTTDGQDFYWMTGGECRPGSWQLKKESLASGRPREFDSYDPFPSDFPADGITMYVYHNDKIIWGAHVANAESVVPINSVISVKAGDKIKFMPAQKWNADDYDLCSFDAKISYDDGQAHVSSEEFSGVQDQNNWTYQYAQDDQFYNLTYAVSEKQWQIAGNKPDAAPYIRINEFCAAPSISPVRVWTSKRDGQVTVTGSVCNAANKRGLKRPRNFTPFSSGSYAPWFSLFDRKTQAGLFIGWDYFGHWSSIIERSQTDVVSIPLKVAGHKQTLAQGESFSTPKAFVGLYGDDIDNAGNECLDWQYRYMWDYTREGWFPAIRMLGNWFRGTIWNPTSKEWAWTGKLGDVASTERKVFRMADVIRYCGADVYHRDWGWWDRAGEWNGPDWRKVNEYLRKSDIGLLIYAFIYTVAADSQVAQEHPDWVIGITLDMSNPQVAAHLKNQLNLFAARWGNFMWRNDSSFMSQRNGDDTVLLGQDQGFRGILKDFLDTNPRCAFQAVNGGGNCLGYEYAGYSSCISMSDGAVGIHSNYDLSLLIPPDKTAHMPDAWRPEGYDKATWRGALAFCLDMTGDTWDPNKLEGVRTLIDIYHYLNSKGVVGRYVKVYRPFVTGDDPSMYFQRLSQDRERGIIIIKHLVSGPVVIKPKGLLPAEKYFVSFQESKETINVLGSVLMDTGISLEKVPAGELIYLNLPMHPGSSLDTIHPDTPSKVTKKTGTNLGYLGVELTWKPGRDNNWISCYEIVRNSVVIDKVAKGAYYFDHSAGADIAAKYEIRTVDGGGNISSAAVARGHAGKPSLIIDDANTAITYKGTWQHQTNLLPAYVGTISLSNQKGSSLQLKFEGKKVLWFVKMGPECGKAVVIADGVAEIVDTYSADDIWGACVYQKEFPEGGSHTLSIEVLGQPSSGKILTGGEPEPVTGRTSICIDGFRIEP
jgi:hypothetical protein